MSTFYGRGLYGRMYVCSGELCMCGLADVGEHTSGHDHNPEGGQGRGEVLRRVLQEGRPSVRQGAAVLARRLLI